MVPLYRRTSWNFHGHGDDVDRRQSGTAFVRLHGNTLVNLVNTVGQGIGSQGSSFAVPAGLPILVEVKGLNSSFGVQDQGTYQLRLVLLSMVLLVA